MHERRSMVSRRFESKKPLIPDGLALKSSVMQTIPNALCVVHSTSVAVIFLRFQHRPLFVYILIGTW
ncbi:unnamed protein product [Calypogeia fissa]